MSAPHGASAIITTRIAPAREAEFLRWQDRVSAAEATWPGFVAHRVERPVAGLQEDWVVAVSFDTAAHLDAWLQSEDRRALMAGGAEFSAAQHVTRTALGFGFWSPDAGPDPVFKSNLLVLLMLYPLVYLWGYFVSSPLIDSHGVPFWLSLFIGNVVSTQLLGWILAPWIFRRFRWWLHRPNTWQRHLAGYALLVVLYALSMAAFAWLGWLAD
jgi:antibiotic biosynthesis monooxygenase (ABM) superfamily enzyme